MHETESWQGKRLIMASLCLTGLMMPLIYTGPALATASIAAEFTGSAASLGWLTTGFVLCFGSLMMASGALADQYGRKRMLSIGLVLFALCSLGLVIAPNLLSMNLIRAVQGSSAAICIASAWAAVAQEFTGHLRTRAYSLLGTSFGVGLSFGPSAAGYLVDHFGWRGIFVAGGLMAIFILLVGVPRLRETRDPDAQGMDYWGTLFFTSTLISLIFAIVQGPEWGWSDLRILGLFASSLLLGLMFIWVEKKQARPMLDLTLFQNRRFVGVLGMALATAFSYVVPLIFLPMRLIGAEDMAPQAAGLLLMALSAPMMIVPLLAGFAARYIKASNLCTLGFMISALGLFWLSTVQLGAGAVIYIGPFLLIGLGTGLPWGLMDDLAVSQVAKERAGMAMGFFGTARIAGESLAMATMGALMVGLIQSGMPSLHKESVSMLATGQLSRLQSTGLSPLYEQSFQTMLQVLAIISIIAALTAWQALRQPSPEAHLIGQEA